MGFVDNFRKSICIRLFVEIYMILTLPGMIIFSGLFITFPEKRLLLMFSVPAVAFVITLSLKIWAKRTGNPDWLHV